MSASSLLRQIHKEGAPLRPVISAVGTFNPSKYSANVLSPLVGESGFTLRNSRHFIEETKGLILNEDSTMVSFDVKALYMSLPVGRTIEIVKRRLSEDDTLHERTQLTVEDIVHLLEICLNSTYFTFRERFFQFTDGVAMGSPVSSVVANLFMQDFQEDAIKETGDLKPQAWNRYVEDVFSILQEEQCREISSVSQQSGSKHSFHSRVRAERSSTLS